MLIVNIFRDYYANNTLGQGMQKATIIPDSYSLFFALYINIKLIAGINSEINKERSTRNPCHEKFSEIPQSSEPGLSLCWRVKLTGKLLGFNLN